MMDINKLKELCNKYTVEVSFNGFKPFKHKVIDAELLLTDIHLTSNLSKDEFVKYINSGDFITPEYKSIFKSIKSQGIFKLAGHEALGNHSYIECKSLKWL
jgi:hypothetical protein